MWLYTQPGVLAVPDCSVAVTEKFVHWVQSACADSLSLIKKAKGTSDLVACVANKFRTMQRRWMDAVPHVCTIVVL